jgi:alpha-1,2-mannosyltransferase
VVRVRRAYRIGGMTALAVGVGVFVAVIPGHRGWFDVGVYYGAVHHWAAGGQLYEYLRPGTPYGFTYPPFAALCMAPVLLGSWHGAVAASVVLNLAAVGLLLHWLVGPIAARRGWNRWYPLGVAGCLLALLQPVRDTVSFGQVNLLLVVLVMSDVRRLLDGRGRTAGVGIGLAAAIKLTPALFIVHLLLVRRWRAALVATGTATLATLAAAVFAPEASLTFWTDTVWDTGRVGSLAYVSNQSLRGAVARLGEPVVVWAVAVLVVLAVWAYRLRLAARHGDELAGFALTGSASCLISPVTWVHHLVWLLPALAVLVETGVEAAVPTRRRRVLGSAAAAYVVFCSSVVWLWPQGGPGLIGVIGGNAYCWLCLALLAGLPIRGAERAAGRVRLIPAWAKLSRAWRTDIRVRTPE